MDRQEKAYNFLQKNVGREFTRKALETASGWSANSVKTYVSKHFKGLVDIIAKDRYRVRREFRRLTLRDFRRLADQTRRIHQTYKRDEYSAVVTFEFLLPLTQEGKLRRALDDLFYSDTITEVLAELGTSRFEKWVPRKQQDTESSYIRRLVSEADSLFGGYSVNHVSGRFRASELMSRDDAGKLFAKDQPYLIDETTAVVRFIVPIWASRAEQVDAESAQLVLPATTQPTEEDVVAEVNFIRELFFCLFVEALIRYVTGEDQIWLIEESPIGRRLHVWEPEP